MIFLRYGAVSSGPVILTFNPKDPVYPESPELFAGDTVIEIKEDGTEDVFLHGNTNHGIKINSIWPADGVVHFNQVIRAWGEHYSTYTYALLRQYDAETGKPNRRSSQCSTRKAIRKGRPEKRKRRSATKSRGVCSNWESDRIRVLKGSRNP